MIYISKYIIRPTRLFEKELEKIYNYIFFQFKEPVIAKRFYNQITTGIYSLQYFPERYAKIHIHKDTKRNIRKMNFNQYAIIYEVDNNTRSSFYFTYIS